METVTVTVNSFANVMGVDKVNASAFLKTMVAIGLAEQLKEVKPPVKEIEPGIFVQAPGKGQNLFKIPRNITLNLPAHLKDEVIPKLHKIEKKTSYVIVPDTIDDGVVTEPEVVTA